jgi:hypothetical protein
MSSELITSVKTNAITTGQKDEGTDVISAKGKWGGIPHPKRCTSEVLTVPPRWKENGLALSFGAGSPCRTRGCRIALWQFSSRLAVLIAHQRLVTLSLRNINLGG